MRDEQGAEAFLLIAPAWWARGLGEVLVAELVAAARREGLREVWTHAASWDTAVMRAMQSTGLPVEIVDDGSSMTLTLSLDCAVRLRRQEHPLRGLRPCEVRQGATGR